MFKIYFKNFNGGESERHFELLEECCVAFFSNLGPSVQRIELHEKTGEDSERLIIQAYRMAENEHFKISRVFNIF